MKTIFLIFFTFFYLFSISNCSTESEKEVNERVETLYMAIILKAKECNTSPTIPLIRLDSKQTPPKYGTRACTVEIILQPCPFISYPPICLEFYKYDVPNNGPDIKL